MPSLEILLLSCPPSFLGSCMSINRLCSVDPAGLRGALALAAHTAAAPSSSVATQPIPEEWREHVSLLQYINRLCADASPSLSPDELKRVLATSTILHEAVVDAFVDSRTSNSTWHATFGGHNGKLLDMQWKLGLSLESNSCKNLNSIFVTLLFRVLTPDNVEAVHTIELPYAKFQEFYLEMKDATIAMNEV